MKPGKPAAAHGDGTSGDGSSEVLRARLRAAGIAPLRHDAVVADLANDPPLGRALVETALAHPDRIVAAVGAALIAARAARGAVVVRDAAAHKALVAAANALQASALEVVRLPDAWPIAGLDRELGWKHAWVLGADELRQVEAVGLSRVPWPRRITVAGDVARPHTVALEAAGAVPSVEALVEQAGGATALPWAALDGGAWGGRVADPEEPPRTSLLLVLPARHALVRRAQLSVADQLRRVASACEGCRACTDVCPPFLDGRALHPHAIVAALASAKDARNESAAARACLECGVCTAACPSGLDPGRLVGEVKSRLPAEVALPRRGRAHPDRASRRMGVPLLLLRAGLAEADGAGEG